MLMFHCKNKRSHTFNQPSGPLWAYSWGSVCFLSVSPAVKLCLDPRYTATERRWLRFNLVTLFLVSWPRSVVLPGAKICIKICHLYISFCNQPTLFPSSLYLYHKIHFNSPCTQARNIWQHLSHKKSNKNIWLGLTLKPQHGWNPQSWFSHSQLQWIRS